MNSHSSLLTNGTRAFTSTSRVFLADNHYYATNNLDRDFSGALNMKGEA